MMDMYQLLKELFPICRSITGNGVRKTFDILQRHVDLKIQEYPSGMQCYDWVIPDEWNIRSASIRDENGKYVANFANNNLHVLGYSVPVSETFTLEELKKHLHSDPDRPNVSGSHLGC